MYFLTIKPDSELLQMALDVNYQKKVNKNL